MVLPKEETMARVDIEADQLEKLKKQVKTAYEKVDLYRKKMDEQGVKPEDIKSLEDLKELPFVFKDDFRTTYPNGLFAVPMKDIVRTHASSGTTGKPTVVGYTRGDMKRWVETTARVAAMGGASADDTAQICFGYGLFTGGLGLHYALEHLGANVIPMSAGGTARQIMFMKDLGTTVIVATPSYALHISETLIDMGIDPATDMKVRTGLLGGEGLSEPMRAELNDIWKGKVNFTQNYGMSELNGPGIAGECLEYNGMHVMEDHFIAEVIDPDTGQPLPEGEEGELVISCITKEAIPLLRYRTGDITRLHKDSCACGRTTTRIEPLVGRTDDMLLIRGVNVFPSQIAEAISEFNEIGPNYEIVVTREGSQDLMEVKVELVDGSLLDSYSLLENLETRIKHKVRDIIGLDIKLSFYAPRSLQRFEGKAKRVEDLR